MRLEVLIVLEVAVPLQKTEALRVLRLERAHVERARVVERAPEPLAGREIHQHTVRVVGLRAEVGERADTVLAVKEHAVQRGNPELPDLLPQEQTAFDVDDGLLAGRDHEPISAGEARAVQQREDRQLLGARTRRHEPEFPEPRELLAA